MKPYYQDDYVTLYNADCREVLPTFTDKSIDITCVDPVYGMDYESNHYKVKNPFGKLKQDNEVYPVDILRDCFRLTRRAVFSFCRWNNIAEIPEPKSLIIWVKNNWTAGDLEHEYGRQYECADFYAMEEHAFNSIRPHDVIPCDRVSATNLFHPTEKPVDLIKKLLNDNIGELVLDPCCGSGTTLVAAKQLGRKSIGIELEEKYCEIAAKRLSQDILPFDVPEKPRSIQLTIGEKMLRGEDI